MLVIEIGVLHADQALVWRYSVHMHRKRWEKLMGDMTSGHKASAVAITQILALTFAIGGCGIAAAAGGLADGEYDCGGGYTFRSMGKVDIQNGQFRYRPFGEVVNGFASYSVGANRAIQWGGQFGGLDDAPARIVAATREDWGFNVKYQGTPGGLINTMSCHAPGK